MSCSALALSSSPPMIVESDLLGPITVETHEVLEFAQGLYGFPETRSFVLLPSEREGLYWLQSVEHSPLAFLLIDPFLYFEGYSVDLGPGDLSELGGKKSSDIVILAIVSLPASRDERPTANLQGPLAINLKSTRGRQLAISDSDFGVRCEFDLEKATA